MASFTGIGSAFGSFFGSSDLEDAYKQAIEEYRLFKAQADKTLEGFRTKGQTTYEKFLTSLTAPEMAPDIAQLRSMLTSTIAGGLSPLAQLYMEDANRYLENRAISTGNLRSGAVALQRGELGRRVVADEFTRALNTLQTLRQGDVAGATLYGQAALGYGQAENIALGTVGTAVAGLTGAQVGRGLAQYAGDVALGQGIGGVFDMGATAAGAQYGFGGLDLSGLKNYFTGTVTAPSGATDKPTMYGTF